MTLITTSAGVLWIDECGSGDPLLLLHANPGDPADFDAVLPSLAERYRVIRVSWPGYGQGPAPLPPQSASAMQFAELLVQLVRVMDLKNVCVIGNSVGGYAAAWLALCYPERLKAMVLVSACGFSRHTRWTQAFCRLMGREWVTRFMVRWMPFLYLRGRASVVKEMRLRAATAQRLAIAVAVNAAVWRSFLDPAHDLRDSAKRMQTPTLVLSGRYDPLVLVEDGETAAACIPGAHHVVLPCGHAPFAEMPELFLQVVNPFLSHPPALVKASAE
jgi:pimeloyl-ACP methyl ester carboxylesterase